MNKKPDPENGLEQDKINKFAKNLQLANFRVYCREKTFLRLKVFLAYLAACQAVTILTLILTPGFLERRSDPGFVPALAGSLVYVAVIGLSVFIFRYAKKEMTSTGWFSDVLAVLLVCVFLLCEGLTYLLTYSLDFSFVRLAIAMLVTAFVMQLDVIINFIVLTAYFAILAIVYVFSNSGAQARVFSDIEIFTSISYVVSLAVAFVSHRRTLRDFRESYAVSSAMKELETYNKDLNVRNEELEKMSMVDSLTEIANRAAFDDYIKLKWEDCMRAQRLLTVFTVDVDHYKELIDYSGIEVAEEFLKKLAALMTDNFRRAGDICARYSGDRFVGVMPYINMESAMSIAERLRAGVEGMMVASPASTSSPYVTVSVGVAGMVPTEEDDAKHLVTLSGAALYTAKGSGRNRVVSNFSGLPEEGAVAPRVSVIKIPGLGEDLERLQVILQAAVVAVYSLDIEKRSLEFSDEISEYIGVKGENGVKFEDYQDFIGYLYHADWNDIKRVFSEILNGTYDLAHNVLFRLRNGASDYIWVSMTVRYIKDKNGKNIQAVGALSDFSEQMRTQEINYLVAAGTLNYVFYYDFVTREFFVNDRFREDFKVDTEFIKDADIFIYNLLYKRDRKVFIREFQKIRRHESDYFECRVRLNTPDGGRMWTSIRSRVSYGFDGSLKMLAGSMNDVTRSVAERQKREMIIEGCSDCVYVYDVQNDVIEFSPKIKELLAITNLVMESASYALTEHILSEDRSILVDAIEEIRKGFSNTLKLEFRVKSADGSVMWLAVRGKAFTDEEGLVTFLSGSILNITSMWQYNKHIESQTLTDRLTGLPNRVAFYRDMSAHLNDESSSGFVLLMDIDDFKNINSMFGFSEGDRILNLFSRFLFFNTDSRSLLYHLSKDLFLVQYLNNDEAEAMDLAKTLKNIIDNELVVFNTDVAVRVSVGITNYKSGETVDDIMTNAEIALRKVKNGGKNNILLFTSDDKVEYAKKLELETLLRECIKNDFDGFVPYYMPLYSTLSKSVIGAEALLRFKDKDGRIHGPQEIIPVLQAMGEFDKVEDWIFRTASMQCKRWIDMTYMSDFMVNINLSPIRAVKKSLLGEVNEVLSQTGINRENIVLEITEESFVMEMQTNVQILKELRESNVRLAIDDFGTGYSCLSYMRQLPVSEIKIDRSFIKDIEFDKTSVDFVGSIIQLSHSMNYFVCVEGVESHSQLSILTELGADLLQGFYFSPPVPAVRFEEMFLSRRRGA